jgi:hypothetical protein
MKVFAIASAKPALTPDQLQKHMPKEVPATLKHYLDGKIEQFWLRAPPSLSLTALHVPPAELITTS